ncbi:DUF1795 domain-containing protein [Chloroflexi bacterium CFX3]|nr:DUF1795 domain-containing protein [Chloroflexi bacterium CFX3]
MSKPMWVNFQGPIFSMRVPSNWFVNATPEIQAMLVEPPRGENQLRSNLILTLQAVQPDVTVDAVLQNARRTQQQEYPRFTLQDEGKVTGRAVEGRFQFYTWFNEETNIEVLQSQTFYIANEVLFTLTTTCALDRQAEVMPILTEMLESFVIEVN